MKYASVIIDISYDKLDRPFSYRIPERLEREVVVGTQVEVPFGAGNRVITGYVVEILDNIDYDLSKVKDIRSVVKGSVQVLSQLISLAAWMREHYGSTMNRALKTVLPVKKTVKAVEKKYIRLNVDREEAMNLIQMYASRKNMAARVRLLRELLTEPELEETIVTTKFGVSKAVIHGMAEKKMIEIRSDRVMRNPLLVTHEAQNPIELNQEQKTVVQDILKEPGRTHLVFGVTGSGKTEVYMELIAETIKRGRECIVLIPEIALTYQTIKRFSQRFHNQVSFIHSRLSDGERFDQFERAKAGDVKIMVGPRSALFTPFNNLGLIIIDEEHESAYKSDQVPKYHAREVAIERASYTGATVVLGSATPSVFSYYKTKTGEYKLHKMRNRANQRQLPEAYVVDMKEETQAGNYDIFSRTLLQLIKDRLERHEQTMLFINRRGYSNFISCRDCGKPVRCPHCDVSLTYHHNSSLRTEQLVCHYCGYTSKVYRQCPKCGSGQMGRVGVGTEQVEQKIAEYFPEAKVLRMDMDTTKNKDGHEKILESFAAGLADILVGTQMIVKGHDFKDVTLVGVLAADLSLYAPDYMAGERTFQLLTQAAGRAGRGEKEGKVVIQTYSPDALCIQTAVKQDYEQFYEDEIIYRQLLNYPPHHHMIAILVSDKDEQFVKAAVEDLAKRTANSHIEGLEIIGPAKAGISKIQDIYRYVMYFKHKDENELITVKNRLMLYIERKEEYKRLSIQFDFDPLNGY